MIALKQKRDRHTTLFGVKEPKTKKKIPGQLCLS
jgi:hypothetical protein